MHPTGAKKNAGFSVVRLLRRTVDQVVFNLSAKHLFPRRPTLYFRSARAVCSCGQPLVVRKTYTRSLAALAIGEFQAHITVLTCPACQQMFESEELRALVAPNGKFAFDVMVEVGQALFLRCRNAKEIQRELGDKNITISLREIDHLGRRFIVYLALAHKQCQAQLKAFMGARGGYILHLDGTCEGDSPHLMTSIDALSRIVLGNIKLPSENAEQLIPFLHTLQQAYGDPIALVHDMGRGILKAVKAVFPGVPDFICHFHFLKDLGNDLFGHDYSTIRRHLKTHGLRSHLRHTAKALKKAIDAEPEILACLHRYLESNPLHEPQRPLMPLVSAYLIISWILEAKQQSHGFGFPFDRPHFDFYRRVQEAYPELHALKQQLSTSACLLPLAAISRTLRDQALSTTVLRMQKKVGIFDQLREAMRIAQPDSKQGLNDEGEADMATIEVRVTQFRQSQQIQALAASDLAYRKMIKQIDKYWSKLFADPIQVITETATVTVQPQRTNNILEQFFRDLKRNGRKRSGNHSLTKTLKTMLAETPLVKNLDNPEYLKILLNGKATLAERFAKIDIVQVRHAFSEAQKDTQRYPKRMAKLFKIPHLPKQLAELTRKKAANS
jgi:hypothetical protein